ncbi:PilZ domain-containing protein [Pseudocolwellia sp. HL-MZ19]|uniref:PilZ domain-containing protein n=1 Tax=unclassified Pseudocolwellia TaxID=2848178 RepID=UPI003CF648F1
MINYDDNRDFYRMMINSQVTVTIIDDEVNSTVIAVCRDLSATGMAIEMPHPIALDTNVRVHVDASGGSIASLDVKGKVVRCIPESEECYLLGINISEID